MNAKSILANYVGSTFGMALAKGFRFLAVVLCIRLVGNHAWGEVVSTLAIFAFVTLLVDQGLSASPLLFRLHDRSADNRLLFLIPSYRLAVSAAVIGGLYAFDALIAPVPGLALLYSLVLLPRALGIEWWFQRRELFQVTTYIAAAKAAFFLAMVALFVRPGADASLIIALELASELVGAMVAYGAMLYCRRRDGALATARDFGLGGLLAFSLPFLLMAALNTLQSSIDVVFLKFMFGAESVARYDIGNKVSFLYFFMGVAIVQIVRPKLTLMHHSGNRESMAAVLRAVSGYLLAFNAAILIPSLHFAPDIIRLLFDRTDPLSVFVFRWAAAWVGIAFASTLCSEVLLALGFRRRYLQAAILCGIANVVGNAILLRLFAEYGAIIAKILADAVFVTATFLFLPGWIRKEVFASLGLQLAGLSLGVGCYAGARVLGGGHAWILLSVAGVLAIGYYGGAFSRRSLSALIRH